MAWPVYSERFIFAADQETTYNYVVPAGRRAIIMSLTVMNASTFEVLCYMHIGGLAVWFDYVQARSTAVATNLRTPVYAGETLGCYMQAGNTAMTISGFLLAAPSSMRAAPEVSSSSGESLDALEQLGHAA